MIKCEVIEKFTLKDFDKLQNIERKTINTQGTLYVGDTFECDEEMAKYLSGGNVLKKVVVKVIEVLPKEPTFPELPVEEEQSKKKSTYKRKTSKK